MATTPAASAYNDEMGRGTVSRRFLVRGRVQGVGYRYFVERRANELGLKGYTRNREDGSVEVYALGLPQPVAELAHSLRQGPVWSNVRGVEELDVPPEVCSGFQIRY